MNRAVVLNVWVAGASRSRVYLRFNAWCTFHEFGQRIADANLGKLVQGVWMKLPLMWMKYRPIELYSERHCEIEVALGWRVRG